MFFATIIYTLVQKDYERVVLPAVFTFVNTMLTLFFLKTVNYPKKNSKRMCSFV